MPKKQIPQSPKSTHLQLNSSLKPVPNIYCNWPEHTFPELLHTHQRPTFQSGEGQETGEVTSKYPDLGPEGKRITAPVGTGFQNSPLYQDHTAPRAAVTVCLKTESWWADRHNLYFCAAKRSQLKLEHFSAASLLTFPSPLKFLVTFFLQCLLLKIRLNTVLLE